MAGSWANTCWRATAGRPLPLMLWTNESCRRAAPVGVASTRHGHVVAEVTGVTGVTGVGGVVVEVVVAGTIDVVVRGTEVGVMSVNTTVLAGRAQPTCTRSACGAGEHETIPATARVAATRP